jgi:hypothetical protein
LGADFFFGSIAGRSGALKIKEVALTATGGFEATGSTFLTLASLGFLFGDFESAADFLEAGFSACCIPWRAAGLVSFISLGFVARLVSFSGIAELSFSLTMKGVLQAAGGENPHAFCLYTGYKSLSTTFVID